jgi:hypothetical protein
MKKLYVIAFLFLSQQLFAQLPEDALRMSWTTPSGTARQQAIGGAMGSLGGEISSLFVNPAGLGMYKTAEFVLSPGFHLLNDKSTFRGTGPSGNTATNFNLGTSGFVYGYTNMNGGSNAISVAVNRMASFNSNISYKGQNNYSSFSEQYAEEFRNSNESIDNALNDPGISYGTRMALYTYLIDTATTSNGNEVVGLPDYKVLRTGGMLNQEYNVRTTGGITEIAIGFAGNNHDKFYIGGSIGLPLVNYSRTLSFSETDATGNNNNDFASSVYNETFSSTGIGFNGKIGIIYKPAGSWRLGAAIHTPTLYSITDKISASMTTNTESYAHTVSITSHTLDVQSGVNANEVKYQLLSPWRFLISGSYVFREVSDVTRQRGFITADVEYVTNGSSRFGSSADDNSGNTDDSYFTNVNNDVKNSYKGNLNFKLGGELKFNTIMVRAGGAYYMSPYRDKELQANRLFLSGGLGYRNKGIFVDLTYVQGFTQDVNFPYRLADKANTFATVKESSGTILLTVGFKFM